MINREKSAIMFSPNTRRNERDEVMQELAIAKETMNERFLGLPVFVGRSKTKVFAYLKECIWTRIQGVEREDVVESGEGSAYKSRGPSYPNLCNGLL